MKTRAARKIHPWRGSGQNAPGYSRPPQQPVQAPQSASDDWDDPQGHTVELGSQSAAQQRMRMRVAGMQGLSYIDPPRVPKDEPTTQIFLDGRRVRIPSAWKISISTSRGRDALFVIDAADILHVLLIDPAGKLRELSGVPADLVQEIRAERFSGSGR